MAKLNGSKTTIQHVRDEAIRSGVARLRPSSDDFTACEICGDRGVAQDDGDTFLCELHARQEGWIQ